MTGALGKLFDEPGLGLGEMHSAFDAARVSRRDAGFLPLGLGPNAENEQFGGLNRIWARSTHLHDNNELVDNATEQDIDRVIGTGIDDIEPDTGWPDVDEQISALYEYAFPAADPDRVMSVAEIQSLYWRERRRTGECGVRIVMAEAWRGYPFMPAIELIEAERIPTELNGVNPATGNEVRQGVEYDDKWRIVAYHVLVANPKDGQPGFGGLMGSSIGFVGFDSPDLVRVPASELHLAKRQRRIRQLRGVPDLVSAMRTIRTEDEYVDTQMLHARTAASIGVVMDAPDAAMFKPDSSGQSPLLVDAMGKPVTSIAAAGVAFKKPNTAAPMVMHANLPGPQFEQTVRGLQRRESRGLGGPYSAISGDYSQETFASNRANRIDQRQRDLRHQDNGLWRPLMRPYCRALVQYGLLSRRVLLTNEQMQEVAKNPERLYRSTIPQPGDVYVNPAQEASAIQMDIETGVRSEIEAIGTRGGSWKRVVRQRVKFETFERDERIKAGLPPERPTKIATAQNQNPAATNRLLSDDEGVDGAGSSMEDLLTRMRGERE